MLPIETIQQLFGLNENPNVSIIEVSSGHIRIPTHVIVYSNRGADRDEFLDLAEAIFPGVLLSAKEPYRVDYCRGGWSMCISHLAIINDCQIMFNLYSPVLYEE